MGMLCGCEQVTKAALHLTIGNMNVDVQQTGSKLPAESVETERGEVDKTELSSLIVTAEFGANPVATPPGIEITVPGWPVGGARNAKGCIEYCLLARLLSPSEIVIVCVPAVDSGISTTAINDPWESAVILSGSVPGSPSSGTPSRLTVICELG